MLQQTLSNYTFGLIGYPLEHSFSQQFFSALFAKDGSMRSYGVFPLQELSSQSLYSLLLLNPNLKGFNVTAPHKIAIIDYLGSIDDSAAEVGAVNTVKVHRDAGGRILELIGYNTDVVGFTQAIHPLLLPHDKAALILGTGGASRAAMTAFKNMGIATKCVSRNPKADNIAYTDISPALLGQYPIIVNATPIGTFPNTDACPPFPCEMLGAQNLCFDMIYNPEQTLFLSRAAKQSARTCNGLSMLFAQAMASLKIWEQP